ncbi:hypothetical protein [Polyangium aurulentum]|uniref:hypothetical protein n=1 Tax=Polyangium aurulentum TaxID=2567896 RepID=UPI0010AED791|nr:hypothetical protein [Polyangium aurulentum]UQA60426.1 hypothetical protein E8A73_008110 [Polyangium aurulentum]
MTHSRLWVLTHARLVRHARLFESGEDRRVKFEKVERRAPRCAMLASVLHSHLLLPLTALALSTTVVGCFWGDSVSVEEAARSAARRDFNCDTIEVRTGLQPFPSSDGQSDPGREDVLVSGCGRSAIYACSQSDFTLDWSCTLTDQIPH